MLVLVYSKRKYVFILKHKICYTIINVLILAWNNSKYLRIVVLKLKEKSIDYKCMKKWFMKHKLKMTNN